MGSNHPMAKYKINLENIKKGIRHPGRVFDEIVLEHSYRLASTLINSRQTIGTNIFDRN